MKRFLLVILLLSTCHIYGQTSYYVSPTGSDTNAGTVAAPFQTVAAAQAAVQAVNKSMSGDITVYLRGGTYSLTNPVTFTSADSGYNGYHVLYTAFTNESPVISGGKIISGWTLYNTSSNIWKASVAATDNFRQIYVNGVKAIRARSTNASSLSTNATGYTTTDTNLQHYGNITNMEVVSQSSLWEQSRFPIASITGSTIAIQDPCRTTVANAGGYPTYANPKWIENAYEYLTQAGYWYLDLSTHTLYYKPRNGEDMTTATVEVPVVETLFNVSGTSNAPVSNLTFSGLTFRLSNWLQPSTGIGLACAQANQGDPWHVLGAFEITGGHNITVSSCTFRELGGDGINILTASQNTTVDRCLFLNIAAGAVQVGQCRSADLQLQLGSPNLVTNVAISNCTIHDVCTDYQASCGIFFGWTQSGTISHNEIYNVPYTGISLGLGWQSSIPTYTIGNQIVGNKIHDHLKTLSDGGGIYVNGYQQSGTISANYLYNQGNVYGVIYLDQGSANWSVTGNVVKKASGDECLFYRGPNNHFNSNYVDNSYVRADSFGDFTTNQVPSGYLPGGTSITAPSGVTNSTVVTNSVWPAAAVAIMNASGPYPQFPMASATFINSTGGTWSVLQNWSGGAFAFGADQTADFSTLALSADATVVLDNAYTIGSLLFGDTTASHGWILNGPGTPLTLAVSSNSPVILVSNQTATLNLPLAGGSGLTKTGAGALTFSATNTYTGGTAINAGALIMKAPAAYGTNTIATGATLDFQSGGAFNNSLNTAAYTVAGTGVLKLSISLSVNQGGVTNGISYPNSRVNVQMGSGGLIWVTGNSSVTASGYYQSLWQSNQASLQVDAGSSIAFGEGGTNGVVQVDAVNGGGNILQGWTTFTNNFIMGVAGGSGAFSGTISATTTNILNITKSGTGTQVLTGTNTYTGTTTISGGTLTLGGNGLLSSNGIYSASITNKGCFCHASSAPQTLAGVISGTGTVVQAGSGVLILAATNTFTGSTIVSNGVLRLGNPVALATNTHVSLMTGGTLDLAFSGTNLVSALAINGVDQGNGVFNAGNMRLLTGSGNLKVGAGVAAPVASFVVTPTNGYAPLIVTFTDNSLGAITNRQWTFGDSTVTNLFAVSVTHRYTAGIYPVQLVVTGGGGSATNTQGLVTILPVPPPALQPSGFSVVPNGGNVTVQMMTTNGLQYRLVHKDNLFTNSWTPVVPPLPNGWTNGINGPVTFQDMNATGVPVRFYRIESKSLSAP